MDVSRGGCPWSISTNANALHMLLGPNHILHRAAAFKDFAHLFEDMAPDLGKEFIEVWHEFVKDLADIKKIIDERNDKRKVGYFEMHPGFVECTVSK